MKKQAKKKLESELLTAIKHVLEKHESKAVAKTKKAIKLAGKTVVKKFAKSVKALAKQKEAARAKRKKSKKVLVKKSSTVKSAVARYPNPKKPIGRASIPSGISQPATMPEGSSTENQ